MAVDKSQVDYVAKLARLEFSEEEKEKFVGDFNKILQFVEKLNEIDTENVEISISSYPMFNALREDEVKPSLSLDEVLLNAPDKENGYFRVPKVVD
ncbi:MULTISPECIES: Asp-tRNA(Asn)/Glu-tRNA(Gln) amidotransferase subunit GatC [Caloramator]|jgi:aspartyl-tRNA(Asn)/glutamyl-tRNA(Gln) amidotransferase subunit C|uniref:Aspartyl/glutamyl-tRNA(Asn/Gln) amidotransferase subunit C n=1 Tax=Caloramator australicus RC3 TaxID=857293 RepID=I7LJQ8_9CLOT|nr:MULTISPECIES: Asp-tRNA(Asn)/Glu-tRNA(Gln) amidotransferase subunit GatC [Caloramator]MCX7904512.1 Asp-tRNA(Asn)/Glu-tRNA(Gln) amidotransferase subunit GatC [Caloramator sp.]MDO6355162.1 Asp-tRNA(Asn)/Glu-tRNA(Gln) amidotransferase subunit GatC [Caloramator sp. CAR-1]WDU82357.1 Asp-tRNA(Asn)/Glu-tRNA(Gln) amidotransferase subunit GatC [Caloramator sp. Dgby_cultured_2]CCJ33863.1 Aspartyl-tRNA(Asn) amidotransferase subunit C @ Glutamyl-tRNA(Gln) amidotransferase subunit C [Caloramator australic